MSMSAKVRELNQRKEVKLYVNEIVCNKLNLNDSADDDDEVEDELEFCLWRWLDEEDEDTACTK